MLEIALNTGTETATLSGRTRLKAGVNQPVTITCSSQLAGATFKLGLASYNTPAGVLAYLGQFTSFDGLTYSGLLNLNDTRLLNWLSGKREDLVNLELMWTQDGLTYGSANVHLLIESPIIIPGASSVGGPSYLTVADAAKIYAPLITKTGSNKLYRLNIAEDGTLELIEA